MNTEVEHVPLMEYDYDLDINTVNNINTGGSGNTFGNAGYVNVTADNHRY